MITQLRESQIIVVGTNLEGNHGAGAARQAHEQFGLTWGIGVGLSGQSYGIPTIRGFQTLHCYVNQFLDFAEHYPEYEFLLTPIGTGIAGYTEEQIKPLFNNSPDNVVKPEGW